jgi:ATP-dependent DNA helicase RecG
LNLNDYDDWSAQLCPTAAITDLDSRAIEVAKANFKVKHPKINDEEIDDWSISAFLAKSKLLVNNTLTKAAILLLGKPEAITHIHPTQPQITWVLYDEKKKEKDYEHFFPPFVIAIDEVFRKIRILKYRYLKEGTLFPEEVDQYDQGSIKEALSNCIAHMDYTISGRITVAENEDSFISFSNPGSFLPGSIEKVIRSDEPPYIYRNGLLVRAMADFNMIDSIGSGIKRMFEEQRHRFFPLPDYDISENKVKVTLTGKVLNVDYARVLAKKPDLSLDDIILLDKVAQKKTQLNAYEIQILKSKGLIEGRKPNFHISAVVAEKTEQKADYIITKGLDDNHYKNLVEEYLRKFKKANRAEIEQVLFPKLPGILNELQKRHKIKNLLQAMKKEGRIEVDENRYWIISSF